MTRRLLFSLALAAAPLLAAAVDAPHDASVRSEPITCKSCHTVHSAPGASLTSVAGNANLCASCHTANATPDNRLGFPWVTGDQAVPGVQGAHHRWDASATNADRGAQPPRAGGAFDEMARRMPGGKLQCSTCHDQHMATPAFGGTVHVSVATETPLAPLGGTGTGTLTVNPPAAGSASKGYLVEIVTGGNQATATFRLSNDNGRSWYGFTGGAWVGGGAPRPAGADVPLNDGANVTVTFGGGTYMTGDQWKFYVSTPMLRATHVNGAMCNECHRDRVQSSMRVQGLDASYAPNGARKFSHPVGEKLTRAYDRVTLRDANGDLQVAAGADADGNVSNNLRFDSSGNVHCLTCHFPHNADSNSLTADGR